MGTISDEQIHEVFTTIDQDGSGKLNVSELDKALALLGIDLTGEELTETYRIDDDPETLTEEEFQLFIRDRIGNEIDFEKRCTDSFQEFDRDGSGCISREDMKIILCQRGANPLDEEYAEEIMNEFDTNEDGKFQINEIVRIMYAMDHVDHVDE